MEQDEVALLRVLAKYGVLCTATIMRWSGYSKLWRPHGGGGGQVSHPLCPNTLTGPQFTAYVHVDISLHVKPLSLHKIISWVPTSLLEGQTFMTSSPPPAENLSACRKRMVLMKQDIA